ncbi:MAG: hypothetical protein WB676_14955 [Bryobacteraceae bacterium]
MSGVDQGQWRPFRLSYAASFPLTVTLPSDERRLTGPLLPN